MATRQVQQFGELDVRADVLRLQSQGAFQVLPCAYVIAFF
jgi:hypothetical protein